MNIQKRRLALNLSQEYVAYNANLSRFSYQQLEHGQSRPGSPSNPSLLNVMAVAQVLDVDLNDLLPRPWPDLRAR
ncbi:helix-turn-helix transcriptional regulator [Bifidobacterium indicum]|uniref:helix-turn-helix transcriptional regulator n=1 Tax=Bifidobacterium indicum TaxID=1691 RepID=UPI00261E04B4|nr:helix-turn-helix transcriptional regulator [uncultured Bifidobacterium sp.]